MEYANHLKEYAPAMSEAQVAEEMDRIRKAAVRNHTPEVYKLCYSAVDLTTLSCTDSVESVTELPASRQVLPTVSSSSQRGVDLHLSAVRRNGRCGGRWYGYAYHERCGRISFFADVSRGEGSRSSYGRRERSRRDRYRPERG